MSPLFCKVDLNKRWRDVQNEETLICAKFGKDLFNIYKVIGRKKVAQFFLTHSVHVSQCVPLEVLHVSKYFHSLACNIHGSDCEAMSR